MKPIRQPPPPAARPPADSPHRLNPTLERRGPSAEQRIEEEKAALRQLLKAEGRMGLYYRMFPLEAPEGYFARRDERERDRSKGRER